jgi:glucosamine-6-phosphate deaminase
MDILIRRDYDALCDEAARLIADAVRSKPTMVLGLATGRTPVGVYQRLIRMHREQGLDFSQVRTFNLDEFIGLGPDHPQSFHHFLRVNFLDHVNVRRENAHSLVGLMHDVDRYCAVYEQKISAAGGVDLQIVGIGRNGHLGFNEPGSSLGSRTRPKTLAASTLADYRKGLPKGASVPRFCVTMGLGTIMEAKQILFLASGRSKAGIVAKAVEGPITASVPATVLQVHARAVAVLDRAAAARLRTAKYWKWIDEHKAELDGLARPKTPDAADTRIDTRKLSDV